MNITLAPKASASKTAKIAAWAVAILISGLGLTILFMVLFAHGARPVPHNTLVQAFGIAAFAVVCGPILGLLTYTYGLSAPTVVLTDSEFVLKYPMRSQHVPRPSIAGVYRGKNGRYADPTYCVFKGQAWGWSGLGLVVRAYDPANLEKLVDSLGVPVKGDFSQFVGPMTKWESLN